MNVTETTRSEGNQLPTVLLADLERMAIEQALEQVQGNRTQAAPRLGISVRTLQRKIRLHGLPMLPPSPCRSSQGIR